MKARILDWKRLRFVVGIPILVAVPLLLLGGCLWNDVGVLPGPPVPQGDPGPLTIGPLTVGKIPQGNPSVDGAIETFLSAARQLAPTGPIPVLAQLPFQAQDALTQVAEMWGIPFCTVTSTVTLVIEEGGGAALRLTEISVPLIQLESFLAQVGPGAYVRPPHVPHPLRATSEGAALVGAGAFHAAGIRGSGVRVAVIDMGFDGLAASQARGDLPRTAITRDFTGRGMAWEGNHGTAVAEVVHDVAPGAQLYLINIAHDVHLDQAVSYAIAQGVHIINMSLGFFNTNFYDGRGVIADMARRATAAGILWVNSAGNQALNHYGAMFRDGNGDGWHDVSVTFTATAGEAVTLHLTWDSWPRTADDYDLYLYGPGGALVASSTATQAGAEQPTESIRTTAGSSGTYRVWIHRYSGAARRLSLFSLDHDISPAVAASSIAAPGDVTEVLTVGAITWTNYTTGPIADYSSRGPTTDGRPKPDLAAPAGVTTGAFSPFHGTSASAPHVAGVAALLKAETPALTRSTLTSRILSFCIAMGDRHAFGAGRLVARPQTAAPAPFNFSISASPSSGTAARGGSIATTVRGWRTAGPATPVSFTVTGLPTGVTASHPNWSWNLGDQSGTVTFRVGATVAAGTYTIRIRGTGGGVTREATFALTVTALTITTTSLPMGTVRVRYSATLAASGGPTPYRWSLTSGRLPPGLRLSSGGVISGTPTTAGTFAFTVQVRDNAGQTAQRSLSITVQRRR